MFVFSTTCILAFVSLQAAPQPSATPAATQPRQSGGAREMTLALPHALHKGETAWLLVRVGVLDDDQVQLMTKDGRPLGTISPHSERSGQPAGTYTVPVPAEDLGDGHLALRLSVIQPGQAPRAPTTEEVQNLRLLIRRFRKPPSDNANP
jgi:hypothetical protein